MKKAFRCFNHGKNIIDLTPLKKIMGEFKPTQMHLSEMHVKENGDIEHKPSFAIIMTNGRIEVCGQISLRMFNDGLSDIGYKLIKHEPRKTS